MTRERRSYPRYAVELETQVAVPVAGEVQHFTAQATTLSRTSIQISCRSELLQALLQQAELPHVCDLCFRMAGHKHVFRLAAQVVTHRRLSQQDYVLVLLFRHTDEAQELLLDRLLGSQHDIGLS